MFSSLSAGRFVKWFVLYMALLAYGTVLFGQFLGLLMPTLSGASCSGPGCGAVGALLGIRFKPYILLAAALVAAYAFFRRGRALGSPLWALYPLALLVPNFPSLFTIGNMWGADVGIGILYFPRWSLFELMPFLAISLLFCFAIEHAPGYGGSFLRTRLFQAIPAGAIYLLTCLWTGADLILAGFGVLGTPPYLLAEIQALLHHPLSVTGGIVEPGLPASGARPDFVISFATLANLAAFLILVAALRLDDRGRRLRALQLAVVLPVDRNAGRRPLFKRPGS